MSVRSLIKDRKIEVIEGKYSRENNYIMMHLSGTGNGKESHQSCFSDSEVESQVSNE